MPGTVSPYHSLPSDPHNGLGGGGQVASPSPPSLVQQLFIKYLLHTGTGRGAGDPDKGPIAQSSGYKRGN